jgi:hypothetical protein
MERKWLANILIIVALAILVFSGIHNASATLSFNNYATVSPNAVSKYQNINVWQGNIIFPDVKLGTYTLDYNTETCLINCHASGTATLYQDGTLFDKVNFKNGNIKDYSIILINGENYSIDVSDYNQSCSMKMANASLKQVCNQVEIGVHQEVRQRDLIYSGQILPAGVYSWRIDGTKSVGDSIDFIPNVASVDMTSWAWWNSSWGYKKQINITSTNVNAYNNYSMIINITYTGNMDNAFRDLRFLDSSESSELGYWIDYPKTINGNQAIVYVKVPTLNANSNTSIYMYYGNSTPVSSNSNMTNAFIVGDDFNGSTLNPLWQQYGGTVSLAEPAGQSIMNITYSAGGNGIVYYNRTINEYQNYTIYSQNRLVGNTNSFGLAARVTAGAGGEACSFYQARYIDAGNTYDLWKWTSIGFGCGGETSSVLVSAAFTNAQPQWHNQTFQVIGSALNTSIDGGNQRTASDSAFTGSGSGGKIGFVHNLNAGADSHDEVDYVYVIGNLTTFPTLAFGAEQNNVFPITITSTLISPLNNVNLTNNAITFNSNVTIQNGNITNATLYIFNGTTVNTNTASISGMSYNSTNISYNGLSDGNYNWSVLYCGTNATGSACAFAPSNYTFTIDSIAPQINVLYPIGNIPYLASGSNLSLNYSIIEAHNSSCWFNYNGVNSTIPCTANYSFIPTYNSNLTVWANDSFGNVNSNKVYWNYTVFELSRNYASPVGEMSTNNFMLNASWDNITYSNVLVYLNYNNTDYLTNANGTIFTANVAAPSVPSQQNISFLWKFLFNGGLNVNTTSSNQTVNPLSFSRLLLFQQ